MTGRPLRTAERVLSAVLVLGLLAVTGMVSCTSEGRRGDPGTQTSDAAREIALAPPAPKRMTRVIGLY